MSFLLHTEGLQIPDLQMWRNNAVFDNGSPTELLQLQDSWFPSNPTFDNPSKSLRFDSGFDSRKENRIPVVGKSLVLGKSQVPNKPFHSNGVVTKSQGKPLRVLFENECEESKIDAEIKEIQREVDVLVAKLEVLRLRKAGIANEKSGRVENVKSAEKKKSIRRRGFSLGASLGNIQSRQGRRKSCSSKIQEIEEEKATKATSTMKLVNTPCRKKSSLWNLPELKEDKVTKQRGGRSLSLESVLPVATIQESEPQLTTVRSKKESRFLSIIQAKKIHGTRNCDGNKTAKNGERVVASRYNQLIKQGKRSLPEDDIADVKCGVSAENAGAFQQEMGLNQVTGTRRVKKRWEIPNEEIIHEIRTNIFGNQGKGG